VAVTEFPAGRARIVAVASGKDASPLINTPEETSSPMTMVGTNQLAFALGKEPRQTIAIADLASGRISSRLTPAKGELKNLAASPDGKILYFSAANQIWSIAAGGGEAKFIHAGNSAVVEPDGRGLIVSLFEVPRARLFRVPLDGGAEREIMMDGKLPLSGFALTSGAIDAHGRLLVPLNPVDSWFNPIGIVDTASGSVTRLPSDNRSDHHTMLWTRDGQIITIRMGFRAELWKFTPAP
jgi:hypothetical protein